VSECLNILLPTKEFKVLPSCDWIRLSLTSWVNSLTWDDENLRRSGLCKLQRLVWRTDPSDRSSLGGYIGEAIIHALMRIRALQDEAYVAAKRNLGETSEQARGVFWNCLFPVAYL